MKYVIGILVGTVLNLQIALGSMDILMRVTLPIHEHGICFHLFVSSIYFFSVLQFSEYRSFTSLARFSAMYFILFVAVVNGIVFLISLSVSSLLAYKMQLISAY